MPSAHVPRQVTKAEFAESVDESKEFIGKLEEFVKRLASYDNDALVIPFTSAGHPPKPDTPLFNACDPPLPYDGRVTDALERIWSWLRSRPEF